MISASNNNNRKRKLEDTEEPGPTLDVSTESSTHGMKMKTLSLEEQILLEEGSLKTLLDRQAQIETELQDARYV